MQYCLTDSQNDPCYLTNAPTDIIDLICTWVCRTTWDDTKFTREPRANKSLSSFIGTCTQIRDVAYLRVVGKLFRLPAMAYVCQYQLGDYYSKITYNTTDLTRHLSAAVICESDYRMVGSEITTRVVGRVLSMKRAEAAKYIESESQNIVGYKLVRHPNVEILLNLDRCFVEKAWLYASTRPTSLQLIRTIFAVRAKKYPDLILSGASESIYRDVLGSSDTAFALEILQENMNDLQQYVPSVKSLLGILMEMAHRYNPYPWISGSKYVDLAHTVLTIYNYQREWLAELVSRATPTYRVYFSAQYNLDLAFQGSVDEPTMQYWLDHVCYTSMKTELGMVTPGIHTNIITAVRHNAKLIEYVLRKIPISSFSLEQIYDLLKAVANNTAVFYNLFNLPHVNPLIWCDDDAIQRHVRSECEVLNLSEDDTAIILLYALDEAENHRALTYQVHERKKSGRKRYILLEAWYLSRVREGWTPAASISKYRRDREDGEREQAEINREQARILLNWSQEHYDVHEWYRDDCDIADIATTADAYDIADFADIVTIESAATESANVISDDDENFN